MLKKLLLLAVLASISFAVTIPRPCGEVPFTVPGQGPMKLSSYYGKVIIVAIFITTCPHCQHTTKLLTKIQNEYKAQGLQVVQLAFRDDDNAEAIQKFVREYKPSYPVGMIDPNLLAKWGELTAEMRPVVPILYFIDRNGYIQGQYMGSEPFMNEAVQEEAIRAKAKRLLEQPVPKAAAQSKAARAKK